MIDAGRRVVLDGGGFRAFSPLADPGLAMAAADTRGPGTAEVARPSEGGGQVRAAVPIAGAPDLHWTVLVSLPSESVDLRHDTAGRALLVIALVAGALALACLLWAAATVVAPLARAARAARSGPLPHPVERLDEVGAIVDALNRRALAPSLPPSPASTERGS